jgi:hypothetical protein
VVAGIVKDPPSGRLTEMSALKHLGKFKVNGVNCTVSLALLDTLLERDADFPEEIPVEAEVLEPTDLEELKPVESLAPEEP